MDQEQAKLHAHAERELTRLWRAWRTIKEMCQDRVCPFSRASETSNSTFPKLTVIPQGYELTEEEVRISLDDFRAQFSDPLGAPEYMSPTVPHPSDHVN